MRAPRVGAWADATSRRDQHQHREQAIVSHAITVLRAVTDRVEELGTTPDEARRLFDEHQRLGGSLAEFARQRGISPARLYWWKKRLAEERPNRTPLSLVPAAERNRLRLEFVHVALQRSKSIAGFTRCEQVSVENCYGHLCAGIVFEIHDYDRCRGAPR